ncbi:MAG: dephospho-CoA kinase [Alphaproteobacteria bacterium]|nr:dephospho-CoA kinase [Alphaproteobacteria bacterium]
MLIVGLTGSIAMGKTKTAELIRELGIPVFDSDAVVHELYATGGAAVRPIGQLIPNAIRDGQVDRHVLSRVIQEDPTILRAVENIVHPLVSASRSKFLAACKARGESIAVLDIPLLYETRQQDMVDRVVVVTAPQSLQMQRALARPNMTPEKLELILSRQVSDDEKRSRADYVIDTSAGLESARQQVRRIFSELEMLKDGHK